MKRAQRKARNDETRDPLFNQSVAKALAILEVFGGEGRAMNLGEICSAVGMTKSEDGRPLASINISAPTSRWRLDELHSRFSCLLLETTRAASGGTAARLGA